MIALTTTEKKHCNCFQLGADPFLINKDYDHKLDNTSTLMPVTSKYSTGEDSYAFYYCSVVIEGCWASVSGELVVG